MWWLRWLVMQKAELDEAWRVVVVVLSHAKVNKIMATWGCCGLSVQAANPRRWDQSSGFQGRYGGT